MLKLATALKGGKFDNPIFTCLELGLTVAMYINAGDGLRMIYSNEYLAQMVTETKDV